MDLSGLNRRFPCKSAVFGKRSVPGASGERWEWIAAVVGGDQVAEIGEQRAALQAAGGGGRERALGESLAVLALAAERDLAVDDRCSQRALGGVVGRLDAVGGGERPQRRPDL